MKRLLPLRTQEADVRPVFMSIMALMFMLLPCLLLTTSLQKLAAVDIQLEYEGAATPPRDGSTIQELQVHVRGANILLRAAIRRTDLGAGPEDITWNETSIPPLETGPDLATLRDHLSAFHHLDPQRQRVTVLPGDDVPTSRVMAVLDAVRGSTRTPLFTQVTLASGSDAGPAPGTGE